MLASVAKVEAVEGKVARAVPPVIRLVLLALAAIGLITVFMTIEAHGNWDFILPFRGRKILAMVLVGYAIAASTVMFQTITNNRILTPSIMGFDALYMLIQTVVVFFLGAARLSQMNPRFQFGLEVLAMVGFSGTLYWWLFIRVERSVHLLVLVGIIFGVLFGSFTNLLQRMIDPTEFAVLQDAGFASFNSVNRTLLGISGLIIIAVSIVIWRMIHVLDALALGRELSITVGVEYRRTIMIVLALVTILVSVSTALVGPITFFGLLVAHLAYQTVGSHSHRYTIPAAGLFSVIFLVGGQMVLERVFSFNSSLSIMIDFLGGLLFIILVLRGGKK
ncbi:MAG TPA: iron chelate uptake ABC transporter family permease subunit [Thermomicrobiales bacterium]|nr:iron chelate uptake ABC transporter family permease subunit [Thermomicrobiales bacterium]